MSHSKVKATYSMYSTEYSTLYTQRCTHAPQQGRQLHHHQCSVETMNRIESIIKKSVLHSVLEYVLEYSST